MWLERLVVCSMKGPASTGTSLTVSQTTLGIFGRRGPLTAKNKIQIVLDLRPRLQTFMSTGDPTYITFLWGPVCFSQGSQWCHSSKYHDLSLSEVVYLLKSIKYVSI